MRVTFLLPRSGDRPIGGFKVVYEYANGLVQRGNEVTVVHAPPVLFGKLSAPCQIKMLAKFASRYMGFHGGFRPNRWFSVDPRVRMVWAPSLHSRWVPEGDAVVATAWQTAEWAQSYPVQKGKGFYLIHDYEYYMVAEPTVKRRMAQTYLAGMHNIVTSPAGQAMLESCGANFDAYIPNGIDFNIYKLTQEIESIARTTIGFPSRQEHFKGTKDALEALEFVRSKVGSTLEVWSFGGKRPEYMPDWVEYYERPSDTELCELYNRSRIFVVPSHYEGWGLPGAEAMACGSALVSTDNIGVRAYSENEKTALLSPPQEPNIIATNVLRLLADETFRLRLASEGQRNIQQFTWQKAVTALDDIIGQCR